LEDAIYRGFRNVPLPKLKKDSLAAPILSEICGSLSGNTPILGGNGPLFAILMLATSSGEQEDILNDSCGLKFKEDRKTFDYAQINLLGQFIETVDSRIVYLDSPLDNVIEIVTDIAFAVCTLIDGSAVIETRRGQIRPILAFARDASGIEATTSGGQSWMHEYVHGAVAEHYGR
jgi:hypothetical protein